MKTLTDFPDDSEDPNTVNPESLHDFEVKRPEIPAAPIPLQPLSLQAFSIEQQLAPLSVELPTTLRIGRPGNNEWAMVMPDDVCPGLYVYVPPGGNKEAVHLLTPNMADLMSDVRKLVVPKIWSNPQGVMGIWLLNYPDPAKKNSWNDSAWTASLEAKLEWRRVRSAEEQKQYVMSKPVNPPPPPSWPERSEAEAMIIAAFQGRIISSPAHPEFRSLKML